MSKEIDEGQKKYDKWMDDLYEQIQTFITAESVKLNSSDDPGVQSQRIANLGAVYALYLKIFCGEDDT